MKETVKALFEESLRTKKEFVSEAANIEATYEAALLIVNRLKAGGKVIIFGNGGSAADSQHMATELVVRFEKERKALPAVALTTNSSILTAASNDYDFSKVFSRQVEALAGENDVIVAISTSGTSGNVLEAVKAAQAKKIPVIALTGKGGGLLAKEADVSIIVKEENTARIQEVHISIIHVLCKIAEEELSKK